MRCRWVCARGLAFFARQRCTLAGTDAVSVHRNLGGRTLVGPRQRCALAGALVRECSALSHAGCHHPVLTVATSFWRSLPLGVVRYPVARATGVRRTPRGSEGGDGVAGFARGRWSVPMVALFVTVPRVRSCLAWRSPPLPAVFRYLASVFATPWCCPTVRVRARPCWLRYPTAFTATPFCLSLPLGVVRYLVARATGVRRTRRGSGGGEGAAKERRGRSWWGCEGRQGVAKGAEG